MLIKNRENYHYSFKINGINYYGSCGTADENLAILVEQIIKSSQKLIILK